MRQFAVTLQAGNGAMSTLQTEFESTVHRRIDQGGYKLGSIMAFQAIFIGETQVFPVWISMTGDTVKRFKVQW